MTSQSARAPTGEPRVNAMTRRRTVLLAGAWMAKSVNQLSAEVLFGIYVLGAAALLGYAGYSASSG